MANPHAPFPKDWPARPKATGGDPFLCLMGGKKTSFWKDDAELKAPFEIPGLGEAMIRPVWHKVGVNFVETFTVVFGGVGVGVSGCKNVRAAKAAARSKFADPKERETFFAALATLAEKKVNRKYPPYGRVLPRRAGERRAGD